MISLPCKGFTHFSRQREKRAVTKNESAAFGRSNELPISLFHLVRGLRRRPEPAPKALLCIPVLLLTLLDDSARNSNRPPSQNRSSCRVLSSSMRQDAANRDNLYQTILWPLGKLSLSARIANGIPHFAFLPAPYNPIPLCI